MKMLIQKCKELIIEYKDVIPYIFFGVCTTVVNVVVYEICAHYFNISVVISTVIAWIAAVLFAYFTNRKWVFHSDAKGAKEIIREIISFFVARLATGLIDVGGMFILVDKMGLNDTIIKILMNVIVIVLNYVASKLIIFKHKNK